VLTLPLAQTNKREVDFMNLANVPLTSRMRACELPFMSLLYYVFAVSAVSAAIIH